MIHEAFATDPTPDLPLNVGFELRPIPESLIDSILGLLENPA
jgi:hypothetical protein